MIIYVDVLFIVNFFISFLLLGISSKLAKINAKTYRLILSSAVGGLYSLIILVDDLNPALIALSKLIAMSIMLVIAFKFDRFKTYFKTAVVFVFTNLVFLGIVVGICIIFKPSLVQVKNSVVYFDLDAITLIGSAFLAYVLSAVVIRLHNRRLSKNEIYTITIVLGDKSETMYAFLDSGNKLREPFSDTPVILAKQDRLKNFISDKNIRLIPVNTVSANKLLKSFKADKVIIKSSSSREEVANNIYIALSDNINSDSYSAILNNDILHI